MTVSIATLMSAAAPSGGQSPTRVLRALVVDADPAARKLYRSVLESCGLAVRDVASGVAAITAARAEPPDLLMLDMQLPDVEGRQVVEWVRSLPGAKTTPTIMLGWEPSHVRALSESAPYSVTLTKPLAQRSLRQAIEHILSTRRQARTCGNAGDSEG